MSCERWLFFANVAQIYLCRYVVVFCSLPFYESLLQTELDDLYYVGIKKKMSFHRHWTSGLFILFSVVVSSLVTEALAIWIPTSRQHTVDLGQISLVGTFPSHDWTRSPYIYAMYRREFGTALMAWALLHRLQRAGRVSFTIAKQSVVPRTATANCDEISLWLHCL